MPVIEIKTNKRYGEATKLSLLKDMDRNLVKKLNLKNSRFLVNWSVMDSNSFLYKGINVTESDEEYPIVHIYSMEGKSKSMEKIIMKSILEVLVKGLNIDSRSVTIVFHRINSGNIYADGSYLKVKKRGG